MIDHQAVFRAVYPGATIEGQTTNGGKRYYLVRKTRSAGGWTGCGNTKAQAWKDAASKLPPPAPVNPPIPS